MVDLRPLRKRREILCGTKSVLKKSGWSSTPTAGLNLSTIVMTDTADFSPTFVWATVTTSQRSFSPRVSLGSTATKTRFMTEWMHIMQRKAEHRTVTSAFGPTEQTEMATMVHWVEQFTAKSLRFFCLTDRAALRFATQPRKLDESDSHKSMYVYVDYPPHVGLRHNRP